ncbi:hypothetical protein AXG93_4421s1420 [Marchantia polymorpha subsp. ruderalis]|uniref:Uncharacterized protein n=1 Tax=Marchantia polymorpha subsp. ruderalis TaxID=1480154 RepID=A0A176WFZ0_MARPO|nr:hypothetical protein AXG93_4421s1420 [Marchantia polymorpha subsp. ruderalis]
MRNDDVLSILPGGLVIAARENSAPSPSPEGRSLNLASAGGRAGAPEPRAPSPEPGGQQEQEQEQEQEREERWVGALDISHAARTIASAVRQAVRPTWRLARGVELQRRCCVGEREARAGTTSYFEELPFGSSIFLALALVAFQGFYNWHPV